MKDKLTAFLLAVLMVAQVIAPQAAWASGNNFNPEKKQDLVKVGELDTKSYPKLDNKTILAIQKQAREKQKAQKRKPGAGFFSTDNPYLPGQNPTDEEKAVAYGKVHVNFKTTGLNDNGTEKEFQWKEIFGVDSNGNPTNAKIHFIQRDAKTKKELGRYTLLVSKGGEYKWLDTFGKEALLPLYSDKLEPYVYDASLEYQISDKVKLLTMELGTTNEKSTFEKDEEGRNVATIPLKLELGQVASTKFESEWKASLDENSRPQVEGLFDTKNKDEDGVEIENLIAFPKNDTDFIQLRNNNYDPNNPPNLPYDQGSAGEFRNVPKVYVVQGLKFANEDDFEGTPTYNIDEDNKIITSLEDSSIKYKFKYDLQYDVINGGKLTMTEVIPVTFDANGGKFASIPDPNAEQKIVKEVDYGKDLTDKVEEPKKDRETFKGWATAKNGTPLSKEEFEKATKNIKEAKTFYAIWDNNDIEAEGLEVKESFKDGDTWVNNFIPTLDQLKGQVKIKDGSGVPQALANDDTFEILDDSGTAITGDALKDYLYGKLQEKDNPNDEPTRVETVKAKVTHANGTSQEVTVPIKVIKNIYEAKTLTEKPFYVPADYVKVTLDPTNKAKDPQKTYYYVNKDAQVVIPGEDPVGTGNNQFTKWLIKGTETEYKLAEKPRHQFEAETTIEAQYVSDVIPQGGDTKPEGVPDNFVKVTFVPTDNGTMEGAKIFWVNPNKEVTIPVANPVGKQYYTFKEWKIGDVNTGETYKVGTPKQFTDKNGTTIIATYTEAENIIPYDPSATDPMPRPKGYVRVTFKADPGLKLTEQKAYYVKANAKDADGNPITLGNAELVKPKYSEETGYKFDKWDKADSLVIEAADIVVTAKATKLNNVIPEKDDDGKLNEKPKGYKKVTFVVKTGDESKGNLEGVTKFYVNPTEYVTINPPATKAETGFEFGAWDKNTSIPTVYKEDTTIIGSFNGLKDVIPKTKDDDSEKPAGYVTVTFVTELPERGKIADGETTVYYVKPKTPVTLSPPKTEANRGYEFDKWYLMGVTEFPSEDVSYDKDREVVGRFVDLPSFIPSTDEHDNPNAKPIGYVTVIFTDGKYGTITSGKKVYYVNPDANVKMSNLTSSQNKNRPQVKPDTGYKFGGWRYDADHPINKDLIVPANYTYEEDIIPKTKDDGTPNTKPEGYITVTFDKGEHGTLSGQAVYYVNPNKAVALEDKAPKVTPNTGYDFAGWDTQIEKKIQYSNGDVITAQYNEKGDVIPQEKTDGSDRPAGYLTVTFDKGEHGKLSGKTVYYVKPNKKVTVPAPTVKANVGYAFSKWDKELTQTFTADNTTITAQYDSIDNIVPGDKPKPDGYVTVTFKAENGSLTGTTTYYVNPKVSVDLTKAANGLSKTPNVGYKDTGSWNPANLTGTFTADTTFTFTFDKLDDVIPATNGATKPEGYVTVNFLAGSYGSLEGQTVYYVNPEAGVTIGDAAAEKVIATPTPKPDTDCDFDKWEPKIDKTKPITRDQNYVAQFVYNPATVTLTYKAPDKTFGEVPDAQTVKKGDKVILAGANTLKKDNATLWGWEIDGKEYPIGVSVTLEKDSTATAVWTTNSHTVEFNTDGGSYIPSQKVAHGSKISPVTPPTKAGFTFTGWTLNGNLFDPKTGTITGKTTLVANYVPNVVEQPDPNDPTTKPAVPNNFVKVIVDKTNMAKLQAGEKQTQVFWVNPAKEVTIPVTPPEGKNEGQFRYVFTGWDHDLRAQFTEPETTITAQYVEKKYDSEVDTYWVLTDKNVLPKLEDYEGKIRSRNGETITLEEIVKNPDVSKPNSTSFATIRIRFNNGATKEVEVPVFVKPDPIIEEKPYPVPGDCNNSCDQPIQPNKPGEPNKPNQPNQPNIGMDALNTTDHYQYLIGYPNGNFAPNRGMTRAEVATMFTRLLRERPVKGQRYYTGFSDIQAGDWYANTVGYAVQVGIVSGYPDGSFKPNKPITRAEFAAIASRFDALAQGNNIAFNDLAPSHWGYNAIRSAASKGWITGYPDDTFRPEKAITRAEVTSITNRMLNRYADLYWIDAHRAEVIRFGDVKRSDWYFEPIMEATMGHDFIRDRDGKTEHWSGLNGKSFI